MPQHSSPSAPVTHTQLVTDLRALGLPAGETSPLGTLVELDAWILLLGVTAAKITALHLAEHRATYPSKETKPNGVAMLVDGPRQWVTWEELDIHDHDFVDVVDAFAADTGLVRTHQVGEATATLIPMRPLVEYASGWFTTHRQ